MSLTLNTVAAPTIMVCSSLIRRSLGALFYP
jgi:hypothetical protein